MPPWPSRRTLIAFLIVAATSLHAKSDIVAETQDATPPFSVRITSPLGRSGQPGTVRIVARLTFRENDSAYLIRFFVDQVLVGTDDTGPSYAVEWVDDNPFEPREIRVEAIDANGASAEDVVKLPASKWSRPPRCGACSSRRPWSALTVGTSLA